MEKANRRLKEENEFLAEAMRAIHDEDLCSDTCGRGRMRQALLLARPEGSGSPAKGLSGG